MKATRLLFIGAALCVSGCQGHTSQFCLVSSPIRPSTADKLTDSTKRQILAHDEYGQHACGWKP